MPKSKHEKLKELLRTQISQTEWFSDVDHDEAEAYKIEDSKKMERLGILHEIIGIGYDEPTFFTSAEVLDNSEKFQKFCEGREDDLWAVRLSPLDTSLPKIRTRGPNTADAIAWIHEQEFDPDKYEIIFRPHPKERDWATSFVVNKHGIHGQITAGDHSMLTQGIHWDGETMTFSWDFEKWVLEPSDPHASAHMLELFELLHVRDERIKNMLNERIEVSFSSDYLNGYFETVRAEKFGVWFYDYNRMIGEMYADFSLQFSEDEQSYLTGLTASEGSAEGPVSIVARDELETANFEEGDVLVCEMTTPDYLPLMKKCSAIVCDQGGILSHAAIVARELKKPCIVGTKTATTVLKNDEIVHVGSGAVKRK